MRIIPVGVGVSLFVAVSSALGQTARGEAFAVRDFLGGNPLGVLQIADTGPREVTAPDFLVVNESGNLIPAGPLANVDGGNSSLALFPVQPFASAIGGESAAEVLINSMAPGGILVEAVTRESEVTLTCDGFQRVFTRADLLTVGGEVIPLPPGEEAEFVFLAEQLPLIRANETLFQGCSLGAPGTCDCGAEVLALRVQLITSGEILEVQFSGARAELEGIPLSCPICSLPILEESDKDYEIVDDDGDDEVDAGETVRFTVTARNSGTGDGSNLVIIDRIPVNGTFVADSATLEGTPVSVTPAPCPGDRAFDGCPGEPATDTTRQCLTVQGGNLPADSEKVLVFDVLATDSEDMCNTAIIDVDEGGEVEVTVTAPGAGSPPATPTTAPTAGPTAGGFDRCDAGEGFIVSLLEGASGTVRRGLTASGGRLSADQDCDNTAVRIRGLTLELAGDPSAIASVSVTVNSPNEPTASTATAAPVGNQVELRFDSALYRSDVVGSIDFTVRGAGATVAARTGAAMPMQLAGLGAASGFILLGGVFAFGRDRKRLALFLLVLGIFAMGQVGCSDDDNGSRGTGGALSGSVTMSLVAVDAFDPSKSIQTKGLPITLGTIRLVD